MNAPRSSRGNPLGEKISHGICNAWTTVPDDGTFHTIATDVLDGARFRIELHWPESM